MGGERTSERTARNRMEHWCLDLHEFSVLQPRANPRHNPTAGGEDPPDVLSDPKVYVSLPVTGVDIRNTVPLVREWPTGLGKTYPRVDPNRKLAPLGSQYLAGHTNPVTKMQRGEVSEVRSGLLRSKQLDSTGQVLDYPKGQTALKAP